MIDERATQPMSQEASKTRAVRPSDFDRRFLQGRVIDIGCGDDPIVSHAEPFDVQHGDAQEIASLRDVGAYDAVCSSHCLEHMRDVKRALSQWWSLVREGGYLVLVVPDEDLYEQGGWPSLFNKDHKATFRLRKAVSWSPVSYDIEELVRALPGAQIVSAETQDAGYDHSLGKARISSADRRLYRIARRGRRVCRDLRIPGSLAALFMKAMVRLGCPVDQTLGVALAQIQIIARKRQPS